MTYSLNYRYTKLAGTPVPSKEVEESSTGTSIVVVSHWTPEQIHEWEESQKKPKGAVEMSFDLTKEQYLDKRRSGMTRADVAREQGISAPGLLHHLRKWGLYDSVTEAKVLSGQMQESPTRADDEPPTVTEPSSEPTEKESFSTVSISIPLVDLPATDWMTEVFKSLPTDRKGAILRGQELMQRGIVAAYKDMVELVGAETANTKIHEYVSRVLAEAR